MIQYVEMIPSPQRPDDWESFRQSVVGVAHTVDDETKPNMLVICRMLPSEWESRMGLIDPMLEVAWLDEAGIALLAWNRDILSQTIHTLGGDDTDLGAPHTIH